MSDLQKINSLREELAFLEEERANLEIKHLETKVQLSKELREMMNKLDSLKEEERSKSSGKREQKKDVLTEEEIDIQKSLDEIVDENKALEENITQLTKQIAAIRADDRSLRLSIEQQKKKITGSDSRSSEKRVIDGLKAKIQNKRDELASVKKKIKAINREITALEAKNSELEVKVESTKRVQAIFRTVASFRDKTYTNLADYEEQARVLWTGAHDGWFTSTDHYTSRDPLFFLHSYQSFKKGVKSFYILFKGEMLDEEQEELSLEEMIDSLYRKGFSIPSHLVENIRKIADKVEMGQDILPLPAFWNKTFDFLRKNMKLLLIEDPSVRNL
ncbi:MAG: hypothetical protein ACTSP4_03885 [Candidatus Hodarchaeales archaeon]